MKGYIYKWLDPESKKPIYIGYTTKHPLIRLGNHISDCETGTSPREIWLRETISKMKLPIVEIIREVRDNEDHWEVERYYIHQYKELGFELLNGILGGYREGSPIYFKGKENMFSKPLKATHIKTGKERLFSNASSACRILNKEGIKIKPCNIRHQITGTKNSQGYSRKSAGGYIWEERKKL